MEKRKIYVLTGALCVYYLRGIPKERRFIYALANSFNVFNAFCIYIRPGVRHKMTSAMPVGMSSVRTMQAIAA
jgi:hypothetical protein